MPRLSPARLRVLRPGLLTTVQDLGRYGYQCFGMPVAGAMDAFAVRLGNRLVRNPDDAAVLEMTVRGPALIFNTNAIIAVTGADVSPLLDNQPAAMWTSFAVRRGSVVSFGERRAGARAYLAVAGGLDVPLVLGSRSTHLTSRTGGFQGRALLKDDELQGGVPLPIASDAVGQTVPPTVRPLYTSTATLRVVLGPQADHFLPEAIQGLEAGCYALSSQSDRMGYRLVGPPLVHAASPNIISDATPIGALQVPADQQPILLMADRQTTGGYPKIAVVITADIHLAAQLLPGDTIRFVVIDGSQAHAILKEQRAIMDGALPPILSS